MHENLNFTSYEEVITYANENKKKWMDKFNKIFIYVLIFVLFVVSLYVLFTDKTDDTYFLDIVFILIGVSAYLLIGYYFAKSIVSTNILHKFLSRSLVLLYNSSNNTNYEYEYKPKVSKDFNTEMGVFSKGVSITTFFRISNKEPLPYEMMLLQLTSSSGNNASSLFSGFYVIIPVEGYDIQQIRTKGKPRKKGSKMILNDRYDENVYFPESNPNMSVSQVLMSIFKDVGQHFTCKNYYISSNGNNIHLAFELKERFKLPKEIDYYTIKGYSDSLFDIIEYINDVVNQLEAGRNELI